jgi:hypothetical protein
MMIQDVETTGGIRNLMCVMERRCLWPEKAFNGPLPTACSMCRAATTGDPTRRSAEANGERLRRRPRPRPVRATGESPDRDGARP